MQVSRHIRYGLAWIAVQPTPLAPAQLGKLRRQLPLLYAVLIINALAVAYTHYGLAPDILTVWVTGILCCGCALRGGQWILSRRELLPPGEASSQLRHVTVMAGLFSPAFITWALALYEYGGPFEKGQIAFFCAITVVGAIFCLTHLPQAALTITILVAVPFCWRFGMSGEVVFVAVAVNLALVAIVGIPPPRAALRG